MIAKYALKELQIYWKMNLIIFIQLIATFFICFLCVSAVTSELQYFLKFNSHFEQEGYYMQSAFIMKPDYIYPVKDSEELKGHLKAANVLGYSQVDTLGYEKEQDVFLFETRAYDEDIIKKYKPKMGVGHWIDQSDSQYGALEAVISENDYGINSGDTITMNVLVGDGTSKAETIKVPVKIVGILEDETEIFGRSISGADDIDYRDCYQQFIVKYANYPILLISKNNLKSVVKNETDYPISMYITGTSLITYDDNITDSQREHNLSYIKDNSDVILMESLTTMKHNNDKYFLSKVIKLLPVLFGVTIFTIINQISIRAITVKMQLRNYTIFNICGLSKRMCSLINFLSAVILSVGAFLVNLGAVFLLKWLPVSDGIVIEITFWQIIACAFILIIDLGLSSILPKVIIRKSTPKEILKTNL